MAWLLVSGGLAYVGAAAVTGADRTTPANFSGFATGTALHADAVQAAAVGPRLADVDEAFGGATVNTAGLPATLTNEFGEAIQPDPAAVAGKQAGARGSGLDVGLATNLPNDPNAHQILLAGQANATARPDTPTVTKQIGPISLNPVAYATLLTGQAEAHFGDLLNRCPTLPIAGGNPFSRGRGEATDVQLLNAGATPAPGAQFPNPVVSTDSPGQDVTFSEATTKPFDNGDGTFGLVSEVHQRLAPIKIANSLLVTIGGEWILRATVTGHPAGYRGPGTGGSKIEYAPPAGATPTTNLVLIQQIPAVGPLVDLLTITLQQLLGNTGLVLPANPLLNLAIGEDPRAIGGSDTSSPTATADGTTASAAVDVLRLQLLPGATELANLRVGHMEVNAQVPNGGFSFNDCGQLKVQKNVVGNVTGPFNFHVACANLNPADALTPAESDFTLPAGGSKTIPVPTGKVCTVTETGKGSATATTIDESGGAAVTGTNTNDGVVTIPAGLSTATVAFTNSSSGFLKVIKSSQSTVTGSPTFAANCTPAAAAVPATFTMGPNDSKTFGPILGGTTCSVTETNNAGASVTRVSDTTAPTTDGSVLIAGNDTQTVSFSNAGPPLVISKNTTGDDAAGKGPFNFTLSCTTPGGLAVPLSAADSSFTLAAGQEHRVEVDIPDNSTCLATETGTGGATTTSAADSSGDTTDRTVTVTHLETQVISFTNTFVAPVRLIVTKTVINPQTNPAATLFAIHVQCAPSVAGGSVPLAAGDADFTLAAGQSHGIKGIPVGAVCVVSEPNPQGAARTFQEASATPNDGTVIIPANSAVTVGVTNTFNAPEPPINVGPNVITPAAPLPVQPVVVQPRTVG